MSRHVFFLSLHPSQRPYSGLSEARLRERFGGLATWPVAALAQTGESQGYSPPIFAPLNAGYSCNLACRLKALIRSPQHRLQKTPPRNNSGPAGHGQKDCGRGALPVSWLRGLLVADGGRSAGEATGGVLRPLDRLR